jgi:hypothetical protein
MSTVNMTTGQKTISAPYNQPISSNRTISKIRTLALCALTIYTIANVPTASAGIISGLVTLGGCVGAGILFPASLFWAAAPCYDLTMVATINPMLP